MNICFIGYGNLAKALIEGLKHNKALQLFATSPSLPAAFNTKGVSTHFNNSAFIKDADVIVLAVKPPQIIPILTEISALLPENCVLISVAAGISLSTIAAYCPPKQAIVRCMPNTPIAVGKGATAFIANDYVSKKQQDTIECLFKPLSITAWLQREDEINAITALSGSGPAYMFYFLEALIHAGEQVGLSRSLAQSFAKQTALGALSLLDANHLSLEELRQKVTSKGGTTAAALDVLQEHNFADLIFQAIKAAYDRAKAMNETH
ncbi:pyrroline-5-carboxylate reductase [Legionella beliardensis]|uniref:Pyrroline-5-carboxylate reductase n=1 Tax=Legionella beliardensis TaxID=91822 RepID=A0A378I391_9GAMM|nr:pyrroline-5-carboxylate reductase [Legionella beliardensis]STX29657.1 pyrroline-5-carboxylate reductase [Legionella beliardensis]